MQPVYRCSSRPLGQVTAKRNVPACGGKGKAPSGTSAVSDGALQDEPVASSEILLAHYCKISLGWRAACEPVCLLQPLLTQFSSSERSTAEPSDALERGSQLTRTTDRQ